MKRMRKIVEIDEERCDGCGLCVPACAEGALQVVDGKARLVADKYCDGLGACLGECPNDAIRTVEREAEAFDEEAVQQYLESKASEKKAGDATLPCGCPSAHIQSFTSPLAYHEGSRPVLKPVSSSALAHWPVQIRLVPAKASFLKGAHLLIAADCAPFAYRNFHEDFLAGKVVMVGCPKFDDVPGYIRKFVEIFHEADIKSITVVVMEVPCCHGLPMLVKKAMNLAGQSLPMEQVIIDTRGRILKKEKVAA